MIKLTDQTCLVLGTIYNRNPPSFTEITTYRYYHIAW